MTSLDLDPDARCGEHPDAIAGWRCDDPCQRHLCVQCTAKLLTMFTCCTCGGPVRQLAVPRSTKPFAHWLGVTLLYPFKAGLAGVLVMAALLGALPALVQQLEPTPGPLTSIVRLAQAALLAVFTLVNVDLAARRGEPGVGLRLARELVATLFVWGPVVLYLVLVGAPRGQDPWFWWYGVLALVYTPIALAVAVTDASFGDVLDPFKLFVLAGRLGTRYVWAVLSVVALGGLAAFTVSLHASLHAAVATPFLRDVIAIAPTVAVLAMVAHAIGVLPFVWGTTLGWGSESTHADPLHPTLVPVGKRKVLERKEAVAADGTPTTTASATEIPAAERADAAKLAEAIKKEDNARALRIYEARAEWSPASIDDRGLVYVGRIAARAKKLELARTLFAEAHARNGRSAGHALLAMAQLHTQLGEAADATAVYRRVVELYPGSDVAKTAAKKLEESA